MSARIESKRMTNHNTPQLSGIDSANHCAAFPGLSALSTTTIPFFRGRSSSERTPQSTNPSGSLQLIILSLKRDTDARSVIHALQEKD
jgi:hypothetical protein